MASKYKKLAGSFPAFSEEQTYQDKIEEWKREHLGDNYQDTDIAILAIKMKVFKAKKETLEDGVSACNIALEALSQVASSILQQDGLDSVALSSGGSLGLLYELYPSVKDQEALHEWCKKNKLIDSYKLPYQTLRGVCNELSLAGKPLPSGVEAFVKTKARVYGGRNGDE